MKKIIFILIVSLISAFIIGQNLDPDPKSVNAANSQITEVHLSGFEDPSFWEVSMPLDQGVIIKMGRFGAPQEVSDPNHPNAIKKRDDRYGITQYSNEKVLGIKVQYIARGYNWFAIRPSKPIVIEGICQSVSVFVAGRNYKHMLKMFVMDYFGRERMVVIDKLNFIGWRELQAAIPDTIKQYDYHFAHKQGIRFNGFIIECDPMETWGSFYMYFDELRAITDIFNEKTRDVNDMYDDW
ncbi:MAG: flagellar filament protein FlaA [Spirochaetes bacterium]|nr:flagellar filament protein FlaA [Spirochaetota bacterium]